MRRGKGVDQYVNGVIQVEPLADIIGRKVSFCGSLLNF